VSALEQKLVEAETEAKILLAQHKSEIKQLHDENKIQALEKEQM